MGTMAAGSVSCATWFMIPSLAFSVGPVEGETETLTLCGVVLLAYKTPTYVLMSPYQCGGLGNLTKTLKGALRTTLEAAEKAVLSPGQTKVRYRTGQQPQGTRWSSGTALREATTT